MDSAKVSPAPQVSAPHAPTAHSDARRWRFLGNRLLAFLGAALLAAGLIFFFAYNWADLHRFAKFAIGFVAFGAAVGFALFSSRRRNVTAMTRASVRDREHAPRTAVDTIRYRAALFAAALCIGALLALIGQVYQTGADLWELFALWALLVIPFALLSRGVETWLLWLGVANTALVLWLGEALSIFGHLDELSTMLLCAIAFNAAYLLLAERFSRARLFTPNRALPRIAALLAFGGLCGGACGGVYSEDFAHFIPIFIAATVLMIALYRHYRFDLVMLAMSGTGAITFGTIALAKLFTRGSSMHAWELAAMSCATFLIVSSGLFIAWLLKLHREEKFSKPNTSLPSPAQAEAKQPAEAQRAMPLTEPDAAVRSATATLRQKKGTAAPAAPIWLSILQGIAAWIAAGMLASSLAAPFWLFKGGVWLIAGVFIAGAITLFYKVRGSVFFDQAALSLSLAGQGLLCASVASQWDDVSLKTVFTLSIVVALALFTLRTTLLHRTICLLWAATCLYFIVEPGYATHVFFGLGFSAATILLWLTRTRWAAYQLSDYVFSLAQASSLIAWAFLGWNYFYHHAVFWKKEIPHEFSLLYSTASAAILVGLVAWLCRPLYANANAPERAKKQAALLLSAAGLFAALAYRDPALVLCAALLLATYAARERSWFTAMLVALPILIWQLYYSFEQTLLMRSLTLSGSGALLLGLRKAVALLNGKDANKPTAPKPRTSFEFGPFQRGVTAASVLVLALCLWGIWSNERVLAHGQPVLLKLAPVDPRSLMQGDYVTLRYELDDEIRSTFPLTYHYPTWRDFDEAREAPFPRYAYLTLDEESRIAALHSTGATLAPLPEGTTLALKLRRKGRWPKIGLNAFFFQEGQGELYETAKWAELRVDPSGKALLLNLRDETLKILGETKR